MKHRPHLSPLSVPWGSLPSTMNPKPPPSQSPKNSNRPLYSVPASLSPPLPAKKSGQQAASTFYLKCQPGSGFPEKEKNSFTKKKTRASDFIPGSFFSSSPTTTHILSSSLYPSPPQTLPYRYPCGHSSSVHSSCSADTSLFANFPIADISYTTGETPQANNQALLQSKPCVYRPPRFLWITAARASPERLASLVPTQPKKKTLR
ncbi:hypothetical protein BDP55DRAFT_59086 [Colletotrichum godetiae]|uniref:Uncharacterized protein n=1 Tax=Colletotrichum godetiae TaxID=1209918 RepID=A0AAJ0F055_9PEZI|nr:uncharacterized protein BDP55DRAFT_59086 [Colletotrichum godetiae]KAK1688183.1 hypothetical protein BDP55DRAFT_59086 [Colletotrichum godetiae]